MLRKIKAKDFTAALLITVPKTKKQTLNVYQKDTIVNLSYEINRQMI